MAWLFHPKRRGVSDSELAAQKVADFLRDPQANPLPNPPIQGLTMTPDNNRLLTPEELDQFLDEACCQPADEFEFDDDELDANGNYIGSEAARLNQEAADDD